MAPTPLRAQPLRVPCPVTDGSPRILRGLFFSNSSAEALPAEIITLFPPYENSLAKRFPMFEAILGTTFQIHECLVRVVCNGVDHRFLIAYQDRPDLPPNPAFRKLVTTSSLTGEIVVMKSGPRAFVKDMRGSDNDELARRAVGKFVNAALRHKDRYRRRVTVPPLPTHIGFD